MCLSNVLVHNRIPVKLPVPLKLFKVFKMNSPGLVGVFHDDIYKIGGIYNAKKLGGTELRNMLESEIYFGFHCFDSIESCRDFTYYYRYDGPELISYVIFEVELNKIVVEGFQELIRIIDNKESINRLKTIVGHEMKILKQVLF